MRRDLTSILIGAAFGSVLAVCLVAFFATAVLLALRLPALRSARATPLAGVPQDVPTAATQQPLPTPTVQAVSFTRTPAPKATASPGTAVAEPTSAPSLTPQPTALATFTPLVPTATLTPSPASTSWPTSTPRPATATPMPSASPTVSPTAPLPPPAAPALGEPVDFAGIWNLQIFTWTPAGSLAADQYYVVHVRIFGDQRTEAHSLGIPIKEPALTVDVELRARDPVWNHWVDGSLEHGHEAWWSVAIVRCPNGPSAQYQVLTETYLRSFTFMGFSHQTKKECGCNENLCGECRCHEECCQVCCDKCQQP